MVKAKYAGKPMDLANMRSFNCRSVMLDCECGRTVSVNVDALGDEIYVPDVRLRYRWQRMRPEA